MSGDFLCCFCLAESYTKFYCAEFSKMTALGCMRDMLQDRAPFHPPHGIRASVNSMWRQASGQPLLISNTSGDSTTQFCTCLSCSQVWASLR